MVIDLSGYFETVRQINVETGDESGRAEGEAVSQYKPMTDSYIDSFDDLSEEDQDGYLGDAWPTIREQMKRANALAWAVKNAQIYWHIDGHGQNCWACKADMLVEEALAHYLGDPPA